MNYEELLIEADNNGISVDENFPFMSEMKGLYVDGNIALSASLETSAEKTCVLAEELGHHYSATGDILDQSSTSNRKQELRGRIIAYNRLVGLNGIINAYKNHCQSIEETAEFLEVTVKFLNEAISYYKGKYGTYATIDNYAIIFEPSIAVLELI